MSKYEKIRSVLGISDLSYQSVVKDAESARRKWEESTEDSLEVFQALEEERVIIVRNSLWKLANYISSSTIKDDDGSESLRRLLEGIDVELCYGSALRSLCTGSQRPTEIVYEALPTSEHEGLGLASQRKINPMTQAQKNHLLKEFKSSNNNNNNMASSMLEDSSEVKPKKPPRLIHYTSSSQQRALNYHGTTMDHPYVGKASTMCKE